MTLMRLMRIVVLWGAVRISPAQYVALLDAAKGSFGSCEVIVKRRRFNDPEKMIRLARELSRDWDKVILVPFFGSMTTLKLVAACREIGCEVWQPRARIVLVTRSATHAQFIASQDRSRRYIGVRNGKFVVYEFEKIVRLRLTEKGLVEETLSTV